MGKFKARQGMPLTAHEVEVLRQTIIRDDDREIAEALGCTVQTLKNARGNAYRKLGVSGQKAIIDAARKMGWLLAGLDPLPGIAKEGA